jgi:hypothetical protein
LYEGGRFTPVNVGTGFSDDQWAEVLAGSLRPGQLVVTSATLQKKK